MSAWEKGKAQPSPQCFTSWPLTFYPKTNRDGSNGLMICADHRAGKENGLLVAVLIIEQVKSTVSLLSIEKVKTIHRLNAENLYHFMGSSDPAKDSATVTVGGGRDNSWTSQLVSQRDADLVYFLQKVSTSLI